MNLKLHLKDCQKVRFASKHSLPERIEVNYELQLKVNHREKGLYTVGSAKGLSSNPDILF